MAESNQFVKTLESRIKSWEVKVLIRDSNRKWVDFTDRVNNHKYFLRNIGSISLTSESKAGTSQFTSSLNTISLDNSDRFFDKPFSTMTTTEGGTASFPSSKYGRITILEGLWIRIKLLLTLKSGSLEESTLGTFIISGVKTYYHRNIADIGLESFHQRLQKRDASVVKNGKNWWINQKVGFLVRELLKIEFGDENNGDIPTTFTIPDSINISTNDGSRTLSNLGRPPNLPTSKVCRTIFGYNHKSGGYKLYLGIDEDFYSYNISTDVYTLINSASSGRMIEDISYDELNEEFVITTREQLPQQPTGNWNEIHGLRMSIYTSDGSTLTFQATKSDTFLGDYTLRNLGGSLYAGQTSTAFQDSGENLCIPFKQRMKVPWGGTYDNDFTLYSGADSLFDPVDNTPTSNIEEVTVTKSYYYIYHSNTFTPNFGPIFFLGTSKCLYVDTSNRMLYYIYEETTGLSSIKFHLRRAKMDSSYLTSAVLELQESGDPVQPTAMAVDEVSDTVYIAAIDWNNASGSADSKSYIFKITNASNTSAAMTTIYDSSTESSDKYFVITDLIFAKVDGSTKTLFMSLLRRDQILSVSPYAFGSLDVGGATAITVIKDFTHQPMGLAKNTSGGFNTTVWFVLGGTGQLYNVTTSSSTITLQDDGFPVVEDDFFLSSKLFIDSTTRTSTDIIWGVSAPYYPNYTQEVDISGKYSIFKYDSSLSDHIELANFDGLNLWQAISILAQAFNYIVGFDENGNFFMVPRSVQSSSDYVISNLDIGALPITSGLTKERGASEIYNFIAISPYHVKFNQPEYELLLVDRSEDESVNTVNDGEVLLHQTDNLKRRIIIVCSDEGDGNVGSSATTGYPRFRFLTYDTDIDIRIAEDVSSSETTISLGSVFGGDDLPEGVHTDDYFIIQDSDGDDIIRRITSVIETSNEIVIDSGLGIAIPKNYEGKVVRRFKVSTSDNIGKKWSDQGVTFISSGAASTIQTVASVNDLSVDTVVAIEDSSGDLIGERRISSIDIDNLQITLNSTITTTTGDIVKAYWAPRDSSTFYEVGGTNVSIKLDSGTRKALFKRGDRFSIKCPGLSNESDKQSMQIAYDVDSISDYRKRQYPSINNRFLTRKLAQEKARAIVSEFKFPKYIITVATQLSTHVKFLTSSNVLTTIAVRDEKFFPREGGNEVLCLPRKITHNVLQDKTTFILKAGDFY